MLNENGKFEVVAERCNECLFGPNKIVDDERRRDVLNTCKEKHVHFVCHKFTQLPENRDVCCHGFFQQDRGGQILEKMGYVEFVPVPPEEE